MVACFGIIAAEGLINVADYIKQAELILNNYKLLRESLKNIDYRLSKLTKTGAPQALTALDITTVGGTAKMTTEAIFSEVIEKQLEREATLIAIDGIHQALSVISHSKGCEDYSKLLIMWYVEELDKERIISILGYSSRQSIYNRRDKALRKFAIAFFGIKALELEKE